MIAILIASVKITIIVAISISTVITKNVALLITISMSTQ